MLKSLYKGLHRDLVKYGKQTGVLTEICGVHREAPGIPLEALASQADVFKEYLAGQDYPLQHREDMEYFHYEKLFNTLAHALGENYYYLKEHVATTRRVIATSTDCISVLQCKGQKDAMGLHVYMRSSHYHNLLPVDLLFLISIVPRYIQAAKRLQETFDIQEWGSYLDDLTHVNLDISFGSLHTHTEML